MFLLDAVTNCDLIFSTSSAGIEETTYGLEDLSAALVVDILTAVVVMEHVGGLEHHLVTFCLPVLTPPFCASLSPKTECHQ